MDGIWLVLLIVALVGAAWWSWFVLHVPTVVNSLYPGSG
jgi:hypothetical protein